MKETKYKCDRCGCDLGNDGAALERKRFAVHEEYRHKICFFKKWKNKDAIVITYELCERCRESLEVWLNGKNT